MEYKNIIFDKKGGIGYVTMNRPKALNALNSEVLKDLEKTNQHLSIYQYNYQQFLRNCTMCSVLLIKTMRFGSQL